MNTEEKGMCCANCGRELQDGDEIQSQATGTWGEYGVSLGDHFIMCLECPEPEPVTIKVTDDDHRALCNVIGHGDRGKEKYWLQVEDLQARIIEALYPEGEDPLGQLDQAEPVNMEYQCNVCEDTVKPEDFRNHMRAHNPNADGISPMELYRYFTPMEGA